MEYLFDLARVCHIRGPEVGDLDLIDFAVYIDCIDEWLKIEAQRRVI